ITPRVELLLMFAARCQHIQDVIRPALDKGEIVICDRFTDASYAYQGAGRGIASADIKTLETWVQQEIKPDLTLLFDAAVETGFARLSARGNKDRFEKEDRDFFETIRQAYLDRANDEPERIRIIDAEQTIPGVQSQINSILESVY
ncbi:MAG: dTMP kinase, partial [Gammaproteobacteria bacterium]|nr:dTMP kinase [Gammaproteobacteria bacterium]